jgi:hypothetical protein
MRSSLAGPSVLGHSGQFLLRMTRCSNQIASRNASGDSLRRAITSAERKAEDVRLIVELPAIERFKNAMRLMVVS